MMDMADATIYIAINGKNILLFFTNHIMAIHSQALYEYIGPKINTDNVFKIWVDFHNCEYIDSTTVGTLIKIGVDLKKIRKELVLCNLSEPVMGVIKQMGLHNYFNIVDLDTFKKLACCLKDKIPVDMDRKVSLDFVRDAHQSIIEISPEMKDEFKDFLNLLDKKADEEKDE